MSLPRAPRGDLQSYTRERFAHADFALDVFRKGSGPAVVVMTEIPGISPQVLGFADRLVAMGLSVVLPDLFGEAGRDPEGPGATLYAATTLAKVCVRREFTVLATGKTSPIVTWLRALAADAHQRCGGPGVGVVGMCFTGGFALAMATDPRVLLPVLSQPGLPANLSVAHRRSIGVAEDEIDAVAARCSSEGLKVLGLRFHGDPLCPPERFQMLRERLGDAFIAVELDAKTAHPDSPMSKPHSVLTRDLIDAPGQPTHDALQLVLRMLSTRLLPS
ncbi:MAG: dienelactone hydrolase family protein [Archangium sp.]